MVIRYLDNKDMKLTNLVNTMTCKINKINKLNWQKIIDIFKLNQRGYQLFWKEIGKCIYTLSYMHIPNKTLSINSDILIITHPKTHSCNPK